MSKGFASNYRIVLLAVGIVGCFCAVGVRLVFLHVIDREELVRSIEKARRQIIPETARRGDILDAKGNILATSRSMIVLGVDPQVLRKEDEAKWPELAELLNVPLAELSRVFTTKTRRADSATGAVDGENSAAKFAIFHPGDKGAAPTGPGDPAPDEGTELEDAIDANGERAIRWAKLSESVSESTYAKIKALGIIGVYGERVYRRAYPHKTLASHIVGYVNKAGDPAAGVEAYADFYLRGRDGWREGERDGKGREVAQFRTREVPASDGYSVVLSIDAAVQHMVEEELAHVAEKFRPQKATIIVSDPQTGFILALGNYPDFDLNAYNKIPKDQQHVMRNAAVADIYEPGSTFKIVAASAALNEGLVAPATTFDCNLTRIDYRGKSRSLPGEDHHFHEPLAVSAIISKSSNRGAAQLAMLLGEQRFHAYARAFGFGQPTGFPVGGEIGGMMAPPEKWDGLTITRMPMGHSVAATPLQMHMAMSVIASGGMLLRPQVIKQIRDASGEVVYRYGPITKDRVITEQTARTMAKLLQGVPVEGTGKLAAIPNYEVAGKTGSTQKIIGGRYSNQHHVASVVGFFPASRPQVAISVIIDDADPVTGYASGGTIAAPSFKRLGEQLIQYLDIKPVYSQAGGSSIVMGGVHR
ncbi:MAG TPA: penicillin-binding protein 2 [Opitutus sp.]|nr:penicillin-binding protein 2 [Opitutus sp.]